MLGDKIHFITKLKKGTLNAICLSLDLFRGHKQHIHNMSCFCFAVNELPVVFDLFSCYESNWGYCQDFPDNPHEHNKSSHACSNAMPLRYKRKKLMGLCAVVWREIQIHKVILQTCPLGNHHFAKSWKYNKLFHWDVELGQWFPKSPKTGKSMHAKGCLFTLLCAWSLIGFLDVDVFPVFA